MKGEKSGLLILPAATCTFPGARLASAALSPPEAICVSYSRLQIRLARLFKRIVNTSWLIGCVLNSSATQDTKFHEGRTKRSFRIAHKS